MSKYNKSRLFRFRLSFLLTATLLWVPVPAMAYLDPTTASMVISAIVGLLASLVLAVKTYWFRIKSFFSRKPADPGVED